MKGFIARYWQIDESDPSVTIAMYVYAHKEEDFCIIRVGRYNPKATLTGFRLLDNRTILLRELFPGKFQGAVRYAVGLRDDNIEKWKGSEK